MNFPKTGIATIEKTGIDSFNVTVDYPLQHMEYKNTRFLFDEEADDLYADGVLHHGISCIVFNF